MIRVGYHESIVWTFIASRAKAVRRIEDTRAIAVQTEQTTRPGESDGIQYTTRTILDSDEGIFDPIVRFPLPKTVRLKAVAWPEPFTDVTLIRTPHPVALSTGSAGAH